MKRIRLLGLIPPLLNLVGAVCSQRTEPYVFGMPPMLAWVVGCVIVTSIVMRVIYLIDARAARAKESGPDGRDEYVEGSM